MKFRLLLAIAIVSSAGWICPSPAGAGVVVLCNRTEEQVDFVVVRIDGKLSRHSLASEDVLPIEVADKVAIAFDAERTPRRALLTANSIHCFVSNRGNLELVRILLPSDERTGLQPAAVQRGTKLAGLCSIRVKLLVDDDEPAVQKLWEPRLRARLAAASEIIEKHCRVRLNVVRVGTWESDDKVIDFAKTLREFELTVTPAPAQVAIGFTSQYEVPKGRAHLGGTRGPLHSHILIREWSQHISKTERLEVLVHELGHFLGAVHCPEQTSVMRPILGDRVSRAADFRIGFDPVNTLAMYLLGEEMRSGEFRGFRQVRPATKAQLIGAYTALSGIMPNDSTAKRYISLLSCSQQQKIAQEPDP